MIKLSKFNRIILVCNAFFAAILLLAYVTPYIKPSSFSVAPLLSLATPLLVVLNFLFLLYWLITGFKRQLFLSLFVLAIGFFISSPVYSIGIHNTASTNDSLTVMTYNVRKFNIFKWINDNNIASKISMFIVEKDPDIVALQEFKESAKFKINYPHSYNPFYRENMKTGLATYSKYPIVNKGIVPLHRNRGRLIFTDIVKNTDTIRIYNFHLQSLGVIPDKDFFGHSNSKKLFKRLAISLKLQQYQVISFKEHIQRCKYKMIIIGDMNNTAFSWSYKKLKSNLKDTFLEVGNGFGRTYNFKNFPLRIDYIFVDKSMQVSRHKNYNIKYSDHFPVMATVSF